MTPRPRKPTSRYEPSGDEGIERVKRNGIFYLRDTVHDEKRVPHWVDRSLKTKQISVARERARLIRNKIIRGVKDEEEKRPTFDEAFDLLLKIQDTKGDRTGEQSADIIDGHLRPWFREHCPHLTGRTQRYKDGFEKQYEEVWADYGAEASGWKVPKYLKTPERIQAFQGAHQEPRNLEHDRRYLNMTLKRAFKRGWMTKEFKKKDFIISEAHDPIGKFIEDPHILALVRAAKPYPKIYLQIRMALEMGMRKSEILHLNRPEVNLKKREIDLNPKRVKTRRRREVPIPIPDDLFELIRDRFNQAPGQYLFPAELYSVEGRPTDPHKPQDDNSFHWDKVRLLAAQDLARRDRPEITDEELVAVAPLNYRFHDLRHTSITNALKAGLPDTAIRKIYGVSESTMRRIYAHIESELQERFRGIFRGRYVEASKQ